MLSGQVKKLYNICMKDSIFVLSPPRCVSSTRLLTQRHTAQHGKTHKSGVPPPFLLRSLTTGLAAAAHRLRAERSLMISLFCSSLRHVDHPSVTYIFISGRSILAISLLQAAQEIELHAQFAQHYLARHYSALWRTVLDISDVLALHWRMRVVGGGGGASGRIIGGFWGRLKKEYRWEWFLLFWSTDYFN